MARVLMAVFLMALLGGSVHPQAPSPTPDCDLNEDGLVDWQDLLLFQKQWHTGQPYTPTPTASPTATVTPAPTRSGIPPAPENIRLEGEKVPGEEDEFYETVTISWDPIPNFEVVDSSSYYLIEFGYGKEWLGGSATVRHATDPTSIVVNIDDSDLDPGSVELEGLVFYVAGVEVTADGGVFVGDESPRYWFRLLPRPTPAPTVTPTPTRGAIPPAPENVRLEGEKVPGEEDEFYKTVMISWDPIPNFEVVDSSNYYMLDFGYGKEWYGPATVRKATDSTSIVVNMNDSDLDRSSVEIDGLIFDVAGVEVIEGGARFVGTRSPLLWFRLLPGPTLTPTPTPEPLITRLPSPANVLLQGENVPGKDNEFYETVTISWDPIPDFEIVDSSNYYRIEFGYGKEWLAPATVRKATDSTSIAVNIDDSDLDQSSVENDGLIFYVSGVMVTEQGGIFIGRPSPSRWFRLLPRPVGKVEGENRKKLSIKPRPQPNSP